MTFSLSTRWNASRHQSGEAMIDEILALGFRSVELSYDVRMDLMAGIRRRVEERAVTVTSLHAFCPVPLGAPIGHPELYCLASLDTRERRHAIRYVAETARIAAELHAPSVVVHPGHVAMRPLTRKLRELYHRERRYTPRYDRVLLKLMARRERRAERHLDCLAQSLDELMPELARLNVRLGIENLPNWEAIPTETELEALLRRFDADRLGHWHDIGHGFIRESLGFGSQTRWLEKLTPRLIGFHIHDATPPDNDHLPPPRGAIRFDLFRHAARASGAARVIEVNPGTPADDVRAAVEFLNTTWDAPAPGRDERPAGDPQP